MVNSTMWNKQLQHSTVTGMAQRIRTSKNQGWHRNHYRGSLSLSNWSSWHSLCQKHIKKIGVLGEFVSWNFPNQLLLRTPFSSQIKPGYNQCKKHTRANCVFTRHQTWGSILGNSVPAISQHTSFSNQTKPGHSQYKKHIRTNLVFTRHQTWGSKLRNLFPGFSQTSYSSARLSRSIPHPHKVLMEQFRDIVIPTNSTYSGEPHANDRKAPLWPKQTYYIALVTFHAT